ncbi:site-specific integrase [Teredinibacter purpureus]|uniref:site-specific integrase n=1 Tax=Teredinibacter purpureus TaxID=2731756 RepID=UPI0005F87205
MDTQTRKMTPLRQSMIDIMTVRNLAENTKECYLYGVTSLATYYARSPDLLSEDDVQNYILHLVRDKKLSPSSCRLQFQGIRFLFEHVLKTPAITLVVAY